MHRVVTVNAGGRQFQTFLSTLLRYPNTRFARLFDSCQPSQPQASLTSTETPVAVHKPALSVCTSLFATSDDVGARGGAASEHNVFVDVSPDVFDYILQFLRTNIMHLPVENESLRRQVVHCLHAWDLMSHAFPLVPSSEAREDVHGKDEANTTSVEAVAARLDERTEVVRLPDVCVVQVCDNMQHDQGMKRHALTITYGADGFQLRRLTQRIRGDLHTQLSSTYWQCYQTNERAMFFTTTKVANGAADLMTTSISQQLIEHTEQLGYRLVSSYVTLSPDVAHTSVRMFIHHYTFRRQRLPVLEVTDDINDAGGTASALHQPHDHDYRHHTHDARDDDGDDEEVLFSNFAPRPVGPQAVHFGKTAPRTKARRSRDAKLLTKMT